MTILRHMNTQFLGISIVLIWLNSGRCFRTIWLVTELMGRAHSRIRFQSWQDSTHSRTWNIRPASMLTIYSLLVGISLELPLAKFIISIRLHRLLPRWVHSRIILDFLQRAPLPRCTMTIDNMNVCWRVCLFGHFINPVHALIFLFQVLPGIGFDNFLSKRTIVLIFHYISSTLACTGVFVHIILLVVLKGYSFLTAYLIF